MIDVEFQTAHILFTIISVWFGWYGGQWTAKPVAYSRGYLDAMAGDSPEYPIRYYGNDKGGSR